MNILITLCIRQYTRARRLQNPIDKSIPILVRVLLIDTKHRPVQTRTRMREWERLRTWGSQRLLRRLAPYEYIRHRRRGE